MAAPHGVAGLPTHARQDPPPAAAREYRRISEKIAKYRRISRNIAATILRKEIGYTLGIGIELGGGKGCVVHRIFLVVKAYPGKCSAQKVKAHWHRRIRSMGNALWALTTRGLSSSKMLLLRRHRRRWSRCVLLLQVAQASKVLKIKYYS